MPRYQPVSSGPASPTSITRSRRSSLSFLSSSRRDGQMPDPEEMDAAFDAPDDADGEDAELLGRRRDDSVGHVPGDYDFDRDYTLPPSSPPPFQPYSSMNPAPGNTNGVIPSTAPQRPQPQRHFLGGILPLSILPRQQAPHAVGAGQSGIFANLAARPDGHVSEGRRDGPEFANEETQKEAPPSYQSALRDSVPPYWETTVVLPSSSSPFGPLSSSISGDDVLIDGLAAGNFFGFFWNLLVSASFQFVGFLLTYVLHTTHAAKYGSRAGLGLTLIQFAFNLRAKAEELLDTGHFPGEVTPDPSSGKSASDIEAENALNAYMGNVSPWPQPLRDPNHPDEPPYIANSAEQAETWAYAHNTTLAELIGLPSATEVGRANEWFSFVLMTVGWFLVLTSVGQWWRVKRFERKLREAQRESEAAQAAARDGDAAGEEGAINLETTTVVEPSPFTPQYYTSTFRHTFSGLQELGRGFMGMRGQRLGRSNRSGHAHTPLGLEEHEAYELGEEDGDELLAAQGFALEPMASEGQQRAGRPRGLWGV